MGRLLVAIVVLLLFSGCALRLGAGVDAKSYFVLNDSCPVDRESFSEKDLTILVRDTTSSRFLNSQRIIYSNSPVRRQNYQFSYWVEPPAKRFSMLLVRRLEKCGLFENVTKRSSSAAGDLQINTEIIEFYHDTASRPGKARVVVNAELLDLHKFEIVSQKEFEAVVDVKSYDVEGAVEAFSAAVSKVLDDLSDWLDQSLKGPAHTSHPATAEVLGIK
jgi:cholesterol transport system auxiliary component